MLNSIIPINLMGGKGKFDDFVGVWENFVPESVCTELIDFLNAGKKMHLLRMKRGSEVVGYRRCIN